MEGRERRDGRHTITLVYDHHARLLPGRLTMATTGKDLV